MQKLYSETSISNIADAIRAKGGTGTFTVGEMAQAIEDLPSGGGITVEEIATNTKPSGAIVLDNTVTTIGNNAFRSKPITSISSNYVTRLNPGFITDSRCVSASFPNVTEVGSGMFESCNNLEEVYLPNAKFVALNSNYCFKYNRKLKTTDFSSAQTIGVACFDGCYELEILDFPKVTYIYNQAFRDCRKLSTLVLRSATVATLNNTGAFQNSPFVGYNSLTADLYVPSALISSYQSATNWSTILANGYTTIHAIEGSIYE